MAAFSTIAAIGLGAAGIASSVSGAKKGAKAVENAAATSDATARYIYDDTKQRGAFREGVGNRAIGKLAGMYGVGEQQQQTQPQSQQARPSMFSFGNTGGGGSAGGFNFGGSQTPFREDMVSGGGLPQSGFDTRTLYPQMATNSPAKTQNPYMPQQTPQGGNASQFADFYNSPDYQLAFTEGQDAIEGGAAARGGLLSGNTAKAVTGFGQDLATSTFGNYRGALQNLAGTGQQATNTINAAGQNYSNQIGNNAMAVGNAQAGAANQIGNTIGGFAGFGLGAIGQNQGWL